MRSEFLGSPPPAIAGAVRAHPCEVCGRGEVDGIGCFIPQDSQAFGAPAGKARLIYYPVHVACRQALTADMLATIEDRIQRRLLPPERN